MVFSSITFLYYFLPLVFLSYFLVPFRYKNAVLLLFSLLFYSWGEPGYVLLMILSILFGYSEGLWIAKASGKKHSRWILLLACLIHLGLLGYFKYADFIVENLNMAGLSLALPKVALPIGISFYTFQILSYLVDVYRSDCAPQTNLISFGAYVSMFPQLIAGPIVRYTDIETQLHHRTHTIENISLGIRRFVIGLAKKVIFANSLGKLCSIFLQTQDPSVLYYWLNAVAFSLQIYFDFSGYSDMAIGLGRMFGFHFPENFAYPYLSRSVTEFWRRWHMTLGNWFRDYVYIPLGGNRVSRLCWIRNIFIVWFLTGLWHGASWNFVLWGLFFACFLIIEKLWLSPYLEKHPCISHLYVLFVLLISFVIFHAETLGQAWHSIRIMLTGGGLPLVSAEFLYYFKSYGILLLVSLIGITPFPKQWALSLEKRISERRWAFWVEPLLLCLLFCVVTAYLINDSYQPFLYFRF